MEHVYKVWQEPPNLILVLEELDNEALFAGEDLFEEQVDEGGFQSCNPPTEDFSKAVWSILKLRFLFGLLLYVAGYHLS